MQTQHNFRFFKFEYRFELFQLNEASKFEFNKIVLTIKKKKKPKNGRHLTKSSNKKKSST